MRRAGTALAALAAIAALFAGPALLARAERDERPSAQQVFETLFRGIERSAPGLRIGREEETVALPAEGGISQDVRCRRAVAGVRGWICVSLDQTGERAAAGWVAPRPTAPARDFFYTDDDPGSRPNR